MRSTIKITLILAISLAFVGCNSADCETIIFFEEQDRNCTLVKAIDDIKYDSILIIPSHFYPSELKSLFSVNYNYKVVTDPHKLLLFLQKGEVVKSFQSRCDFYVFDKKLINNGVAVLLPNSCYSLADRTGYKYVSSLNQ